jgi:RNA polymerase sigma-70 factor, ECF subfamily
LIRHLGNKTVFVRQIIDTRTKYIRFAESILNNLQDAEDVVQDCYIKLFERVNYGEIENKEAYMMRSVRNACLDLMRKKRPEELDEQYADMKWSNTDFVAHLEQKDQVQRLKQMMQFLSEKQRTIFYLRDIEGFELQEIELMISMNNEAVRANLSRARKQLRELYNKIV